MRLKFLLRPGWLALTLVVFAFAISCYVLLAPWQFSRDGERVAQNSALQASFTGQPKPLTQVLPAGVAPDRVTEWQLITVTGTYLPRDEVVARLRTVQGESAYEVLTPFRTSDGPVVLMDRGYLRPDERSRVPQYAAAPNGDVTIVARVRADEVDPKNRDAFANESTDNKPQSFVVSSQVVAKAAKTDIRPGYFQLDNNQPGVLSALPLPQTDSGPFFSYALQWIAFGTMALLGWLYFTVRELKPGGALTTDRPERRKSVAQLLAEDEADESTAREQGTFTAATAATVAER
ncbi:SURF1 family cytochrome oxidase biogenesis protein [Amycolatopsis sp. H20-H5]|uniref:SURF1 family cytochrome oxidase biogenesis protein n=1 Tax=Amycolatopsis sp. H20-H5 TaxID=3046309 RepID=UPI002DB7901E|nr:SURF1 family cytochrome oxidase biogenesis protein [Amycolatopsis sp. H20-H5]MEC3978773.1 SURF1 family cytochrome oxidase biogenesis protein [Amycolatopsis sp. H20-H5]